MPCILAARQGATTGTDGFCLLAKLHSSDTNFSLLSIVLTGVLSGVTHSIKGPFERLQFLVLPHQHWCLDRTLILLLYARFDWLCEKRFPSTYVETEFLQMNVKLGSAVMKSATFFFLELMCMM